MRSFWTAAKLRSRVRPRQFREERDNAAGRRGFGRMTASSDGVGRGP